MAVYLVTLEYDVEVDTATGMVSGQISEESIGSIINQRGDVMVSDSIHLAVERTLDAAAAAKRAAKRK